MINNYGSVRVDLVGGTLDLEPINLVIPELYTINLATSLKAHVQIEESDKDGVEVISKDYHSTNFYSKDEFTRENLYGTHFKELRFVCLLLDHFKVHEKIKMTLSSGSPAGAGLGGSSAMGMTIFGALCKYKGIEVDRDQAIKIVKAYEAMILDCGPTGYQDYYPALYGGVLALSPTPTGIDVEQLYNEDLKDYLESRFTLVYSGKTRLSGINNWEVFKGFFDKKEEMREGLKKIARLSTALYFAIKEKKFEDVVDLISEEGRVRKELFPGIVTPEMDVLLKKAQDKLGNVALKICGAGGGGCFLLVHEHNVSDDIEKLISDEGMTKLHFSVDQPL